MENEQTPVENPLPPRKGKMKFLLLALAPMPLGLLIGPIHFADAFLTKPGVLMNTFNIIAIVCCVAGSIGILDGYQQGGRKQWGIGIALGLILWFAQSFLVFFIGCSQGLSSFGIMH